ncbi:MAG: translesion DNA synthesis-associated protein ImuA [Rhodanobacter sp.]
MSTARIPSEALLNIPGVWRAGRAAAAHGATSTGYRVLDAALPGGGWSTGSVTELLPVATGIGEIHVLAPALATAAASGAIVFLDPPAEPGLAALTHWGVPGGQLTIVRTRTPRDRQWAAEQLLRSNTTAALLVWEPHPVERGMRRLQVAVEAGRGLCFTFCPPATAHQSSAAALRIALAGTPRRGELQVNIIKRRGNRLTPFFLDMSDAVARAPVSRARA